MKSTKQLAKELGLLRKRIPTTKTCGKVHKIGKNPRICQTFSYLVVIDFESTCWKDKKNTSQEIIEFPAVLLNTSNGQLESEFQYYVMPDEHPVLSDFCTEFTGISQEQVENGIPLFICLKKFTSWLKKIESEKNVAYNRSTDDTKNLCTFVTWSDWDLGVCLHYEAQRKQLYKPSALNHWIDARAVYRNFYQRKPKGLNGALQEVGIEFTGRQHSGLDDAKNTARLIWRMIQDGCHFKITKSIQSGTLKAIPHALPQPGSAQQHSRTSTTTAISAARTSVSSSLSSSSSSSSSTTSSSSSAAATRNANCSTSNTKQSNITDSVSISISSSSLSSSSSSSSSASSSSSSSTTTSLPSRREQLPDGPGESNKRKNNNALTKTLKKSCMAGGVKGFTIHVDEEDGDSKVCVGSNVETRKNCFGEQKTPCTGNKSLMIYDRLNAKQASDGTPTHRTTASGDVKTPPSYPLPFHKQNSIKKYGKLGEKTSPETQFKTPKTASCSSFKTPSNSVRPGVAMTKITPPMCKCGRRSKRRVAARPGPNQGRAFYSCPGQRRGSGGGLKDTTNSKNGCGFFSWESMVLSEFGSPHSVSTPGSAWKPKIPSPLAMGSIQKVISLKTGQNIGTSARGGVTPIGVGCSNSWR